MNVQPNTNTSEWSFDAHLLTVTEKKKTSSGSQNSPNHNNPLSDIITSALKHTFLSLFHLIAFINFFYVFVHSNRSVHGQTTRFCSCFAFFAFVIPHFASLLPPRALLSLFLCLPQERNVQEDACEVEQLSQWGLCDTAWLNSARHKQSSQWLADFWEESEVLLKRQVR